MSRIKPCPFCGGKSSLCANYSNRYQLHFVFVRCSVCHSQGKTFSSADDPDELDWNDAACRNAIDQWNMRFPDNSRPEHEYE